MSVGTCPHTPGPWTYWVWADHCENAGLPASFGVESYDGGGSMDIGRFDDADHVELGPEEQHANARLIAAAPELYEALAGLLQIIRDPRGDWPPDEDPREVGYPPPINELERVDAAKAALAKARGEGPR